MASVYYKLGKGASIFYCSASKVKIIGNQVIELDSKKVTKKIKVAERNGHIVVVEKSAFDNFVKGGSEIDTKEQSERAISLSKMNQEQLIKYYEDNYELEEGDLDAFKALKKKEMVAKLEELEEEAED